MNRKEHEAMRAQVEALRRQVATLERRIAEQNALIASIVTAAAEPVKRGPGRPRKEHGHG